MTDRLVHVARLDADGVFWGVEERSAAEVKPGDVVFLEGALAQGVSIETATYIDGLPDNPPGRFRWDPATGSFVPLPKHQIKDAPEAPSFERAFYELVKHVEGTGVALPVATAEWAQWFKRTMDSTR